MIIEKKTKLFKELEYGDVYYDESRGLYMKIYSDTPNINCCCLEDGDTYLEADNTKVEIVNGKFIII